MIPLMFHPAPPWLHDDRKNDNRIIIQRLLIYVHSSRVKLIQLDGLKWPPMLRAIALEAAERASP